MINKGYYVLKISVSEIKVIAFKSGKFNHTQILLNKETHTLTLKTEDIQSLLNTKNIILTTWQMYDDYLCNVYYPTLPNVGGSRTRRRLLLVKYMKGVQLSKHYIHSCDQVKFNTNLPFFGL